MPRDHLEPEYLTRSDIARILKISTKQAGRLMERMPRVQIGARQWRVSQSDFDSWIARKKLEEASEVAARPSKGVASRRVGKATSVQPTFDHTFGGRVVRKPRPLPPL